jgi:hypothetical protein
MALYKQCLCQSFFVFNFNVLKIKNALRGKKKVLRIATLVQKNPEWGGLL